jgi:O-antigen/teichoic acid export membrane protein
VTLSGIVGLGLGDGANKILAENFRRAQSKAAELGSFLIWLSIALSGCVFTGLWVFRESWEATIFPRSTPESIVVLGLVLGWLNLLASLLNNVFAGLQLFRDATIFGTLQIIATAVCSVLLGYAYGPAGAVLGYLFANSLFAGAALLRLRSFCPGLLGMPHWPGWADITNIAAFALPQWLWALLGGPLTTLCFILLASQPNGTSALGVFNAANAVKLVIAMLPALLGNVINPAILEEGGRHGNPQEFSKLIRKSYIALRFLALPTLAFMLFGSDLIFLLYGQKYALASVIFLPLAASAAVTVFCLPTQYAVISKNKVWWNLIAGALQQVALYSFAWLWVHDYLAVGLAWAFLASHLVFLIFHFEISVYFGAVPGVFRRTNYGFAVAVLSLLAAAWYTPAQIRPFVGIPLSLLCAVILLRLHKELLGWISSALPSRIRPLWMRLSAMAIG